MFKDKKLETYISKIDEKDSNFNDKISNYKKATTRINELKTKYNNLNESLKKNKDTKTKNKKSTGKINVDDVLNELNDIDKKMNSDNCDMIELINNYLQYKLLLDNLESETENIKNDISEVSLVGKKIKITKIDAEDIL